MVKWSCASALCFNNYTTKDINGIPLNFYRLPRDKSIQSEYMRIFKTSGMNWKRGHICGAHWSNGVRENSSQLPSIVVTLKQLNKLKAKYELAEKTYKSSTKPNEQEINRYKNAKRKFEVAQSIITTPAKKIRVPVERSSVVEKKEKALSKTQLLKKVSKLQEELHRKS